MSYYIVLFVQSTTCVSRHLLTYIASQLKIYNRESSPSSLNKKGKAGPPKKKRDKNLYCHFTIDNLPCGGVTVRCNHCEEWTKPYLEKFNATKGRLYLVNKCGGITQELRHELVNGSQTSRGRDEVFPLLCGPNESVADMQKAAVSSPLTMDLTVSTAGHVSSVGPFSCPLIHRPRSAATWHSAVAGPCQTSPYSMP